ncbi:UNVERIFIED_CONTAM: hypothetical protein Sangu_1735000 [Sesamum angustifolium]|uniref:DUF547 domain-containing protein n=1 Tax=Sesamum angustifolium TaxID=2727405 RepID=A0AAW2M4Z7_9LAMI
MVRCMAAVYCWLQSTSSVKTEQNISSSTKSPSSAILPRWDVEKKDGSTKSTVEISWISTDKSNFSRASYVISNYRVLVEQLEKVNVRRMDTDAQIAFWINLYNSLVMHAYLAFGIPHNSLRRSLFGSLGNILLQLSDTIFVFSPALRPFYGIVIGAANVKEELEAAKREFLQANVIIEKSKKIFLPKLIEKYAKEAGVPFDEIIYWVSENVDKKLHESIHKFHDGRPNKRTSQNIKWLPYSSKFRYVFSKELTEKPWWV